jgi:hypothetical protein
MIETGCGFRFPAKALQMRFCGPIAQADHFERHGAIETLLPSTKYDALAALADFLQQFVVAEVAERLWRWRGFLFIRSSHAIVAAGVNDPGYRFLVEQTKAGL